MKRKFTGLLCCVATLVVIGVAACTPSPDDAEATSGRAYTGGTAAAADAFPGIVSILDGCTASVVSPTYLLTAGHCIEEARLSLDAIRVNVRVGQSIDVRWGREGDS